MTESSIQSVNETILPRRYQKEIFQRAQECNVIAALDTGKWKDFHQYFAHRMNRATRESLVEQQANFIAAHTPLRVEKFHGSPS
ncbi:uncharacterized protein F5891DRAFT_1035302 [Suillus fuscotomentosus]|uniref:Uncharacterized protein n=1 Tax=Suillus fuscotomentosus TaxID=1912939 RepID=A0AAD4E619_9AGAM|nr:uncharacterized protein F5891DRAFT_1035302 [Suillus fuscotomentosus]KAG1899941.1 hypothetical protein F5891DRAFT_1035302 [Suillus fuscotomentosus]